MSKRPEITMEDVEIAIKVLNEFMRRSREATITFRRFEAEFRSKSGRMPFSMEDFMSEAFNIAKQKQQAGKQAQTEAEPEPLTEEELERMRQIKDKMKGERVTP